MAVAPNIPVNTKNHFSGTIPTKWLNREIISTLIDIPRDEG
jgi:hypothetical protein